MSRVASTSRLRRIVRIGAPLVALATFAAASLQVRVGGAMGQVPPRRPRHVNEDTEKAIRKGLNWLAQKQSRDGFWTDENNYGSYPVCMTALAGLALSASGSTPTQGAYAPNVSRAVTWLMGSAQDDGLISRGGTEVGHSMYGHGFAMLFMAQVYGMEQDRDRLKRMHRVLQEAVKLTDAAQSSRGGWYYTPDSGYDEGSVTVTQVQGLRACRDVGIAVPKPVIDQAMRYLERSALENGGIAYRVGMSEPRPPITAAAVVCWYNAGQSDTPLCRKNLKYVIDTIGANFDSGRVWSHKFYAHLYMAQAMYLSGDANWDDYFPKIRDQLLARQADDGSWEGDGAGRVYGTSLGLIILQLPYQYLPIMQR